MRQLTLFFFWLFGTVPTASDRLRQFHPTREELSLFFLFLFLVLLIFNGVCFISWRFFFFWFVAGVFYCVSSWAPTEFWLDNRTMEENKQKQIDTGGERYGPLYTIQRGGPINASMTGKTGDGVLHKKREERCQIP